MDDQNKNLLLATSLSFLVLLGWMLMFPPEPIEEVIPEQTTEQVTQEDNQARTGPVSYTHLTLPTKVTV